MSKQIALSTNTMDVGDFTTVVLAKTSNVRINGLAIMTEGDSVVTHTRTSPSVTHDGAELIADYQEGVEAGEGFRVNGSLVIVDGDPADCDPTHTVNASSGSVNFAGEEEEEGE